VIQPVTRLDVRVCRIATPEPESDGTAEWQATTIVVVLAHSKHATGVGYSYVDAAAAAVIRDLLVPSVIGTDAMSPAVAMQHMLHVIRNHGRAGIAACAISAVDVALWDLKARLLDLPLAQLLGAVRDEVPVYASGGFTSTELDGLADELSGYKAAGHRRAKIKIGRQPERDLERVRVAREAAPDIELMVDANGAYASKQALAMAMAFATHGVTYFEEPVSSDDLAGLRFLRERAPIPIAAGEYGYDALYFRRMLEAGAVDILQADATRCLGITGFLQADALCDAYGIPLSAHCAPALHAHVGAAARRLVHIEQFRDHVRIEQLLFEGAPVQRNGAVAWSAHAPGLGLTLREAESRRHAV
jgi:L-alanine-DL-glutamate epimerase-like enolase superfamily enzyme